MITKEHVEIYKLYNRDGDSFVKYAKESEKKIMNYKYWSDITDLIQDIYLVQKSLTSNEFSINLDKKLKKNCDSEETIMELVNLANKL